MGLYLHHGLLVMLLYCLCQAQDTAHPEPAPPSLGEVIDAVKAAFEQAVHSSTDGAVREALEQVVEEFTPLKNSAEQPPSVENMAERTTEEEAEENIREEEAVDLIGGGPDDSMTKSDAEIDEEGGDSVQEPAQKPELTHDLDEKHVGLIEELIAQESLEEMTPSVSESETSVIKPVKSVLESAEAAEELAESPLQGREPVEVGDGITAKEIDLEESHVPVFTNTQNEEETRIGLSEIKKVGKEVERDAGSPEEAQKSILSKKEENTAEGGIEKTEVTIGGREVTLNEHQEDDAVEMLSRPVERPESATGLEPDIDEIQAVAPEYGADGADVVETQEVGQEDEKQGAAEVGGDVIDIEAGGAEVEAGREAHLEKVLPTDKTVPEPQWKPEVDVDTRGPIKLQGPIITKTKATGGTTHESNDVNEISTSRDPSSGEQGELVLRKTVEELTPTPILSLKLGDTDQPIEEHRDSTQPKAVGQEAWKIGAISAGFFLILQTAVTVVYILKCRRKPNSVAPKKVCEGGNEGIEHYATNTDTTIPVDEQSAVDDLPEYSEVQQEDVAMTTIQLDSTEENSSHDLRTSVV